jgi:hypothetical protein
MAAFRIECARIIKTRLGDLPATVEVLAVERAKFSRPEFQLRRPSIDPRIGTSGSHLDQMNGRYRRRYLAVGGRVGEGWESTRGGRLFALPGRSVGGHDPPCRQEKGMTAVGSKPDQADGSSLSVAVRREADQRAHPASRAKSSLNTLGLLYLFAIVVPSNPR